MLELPQEMPCEAALPLCHVHGQNQWLLIIEGTQAGQWIHETKSIWLSDPSRGGGKRPHHLRFFYQFAFNIILYRFRVHSIVVRQHTLRGEPHLAPHSYYDTIDYIPCAVFYIPITIL